LLPLEQAASATSERVASWVRVMKVLRARVTLQELVTGDGGPISKPGASALRYVIDYG
jgi:hypothetical protein